MDAPRKIWQAAKSMSAADAVKSVAFGGSWNPMATFAWDQATLRHQRLHHRRDLLDPAEPGATAPRDARHLSGRRHDPRGDQAGRQRRAVRPRRQLRRIHAGLGLGSADTDFDGADGYAWRASAIVFGNGSPSVVPIALDDGSAGSVVISGFGKQATRVVLAATIADREGVQVPYRYGASLGTGSLAAK